MTTVRAVTDASGTVIGVGITKHIALMNAGSRSMDYHHPTHVLLRDLNMTEYNGYTVAPMALVTPEALAVVAAAVAWWEGARPVAWDEATHRQHPRVNQPGDEAKALAEAVAAYRAATARDAGSQAA